MGIPGPFELLVIGVILLALIGIPLAAIVVIIVAMRRNTKVGQRENEHHE